MNSIISRMHFAAHSTRVYLSEHSSVCVEPYICSKCDTTGNFHYLNRVFTLSVEYHRNTFAVSETV